MKLTDEQLASLSPDEQKIYLDVKAAEEAGRNPLLEADLDLAPGSPEAIEATARAAEVARQAAEDKAAKEAGDDDGDKGKKAEKDDSTKQPAEAAAPAAPATETAAPAAPTPPAPAPAPAPAVAADDDLDDVPQMFDIPDETKLQEMRDRRTGLREKISEIDEKWADGQITNAERKQQLAPLQDEIDGLTSNLAVAQSLEQASKQNVALAQQRVLTKIMADGERIGLNYANTPTLQAQFNAMLTALDKDPAYASKTFKELSHLAHQAICALHNKLPGAPAPAPAPAPAAAAPAPAAPKRDREPPPAPPTLRSMPAAEMPNGNTGAPTIADQILSGTPEQQEAAYRRLSKPQREALLNAGR